MTDDQHDAPDIPPALSESEWAAETVPMPDTKASRTFRAQTTIGGLSIDGQIHIRDVNDLAALIALANAAMNDEDPRKFRRDQVTNLRLIAGAIASEHSENEQGIDAKGDPTLCMHCAAEALHELADALESYLPPQTP